MLIWTVFYILINQNKGVTNERFIMTLFIRILMIGLFVSSCVYQQKNLTSRTPGSDENSNHQIEIIKSAYYSEQRGSLAEYDAGAPKNSKWPDLFAETPNYRAYGKAIYQEASKKAGIKDDGKEKFRWIVGPMWYRGRLTPESVKIFVIGQEGAQDENVSNRTFTGSTGTKMQNFINYFGVNKSYLFMNTFSYTITGQYGERIEEGDTDQIKKEKEVRSETLYWLAQNPNSLIVQHRHRMFDYMKEQNKNTLRLVIGVGSAGQDSLITWIKSHGGQCSKGQLMDTYCDASVISPGVKAIGLMHPGAASQRNGGTDAANSLRVKFAKRAQIVADLMLNDSNWLSPDSKPDFSKEFDYKDAGIPYRDFAYGTNWRMGHSGTSTNRRGADGIQIFSAKGCYNNALRLPETGRCDFNEDPMLVKKILLSYNEPLDLKSEIKMADIDVPYESPKSEKGRRQYDRGPGRFANVFMGLTVRGGWPDFNSLGVTQDNSFGFGPIYRGYPENPEILILADQESHDDLFSARAYTGTGGQQLQSYLNILGAKNNYLIIRTLPVDASDLEPSLMEDIVLNPQVVKVRKAILDEVLEQKKTKVVITIGEFAEKAIKKYKLSKKMELFHLEHPSEKLHIKQWLLDAESITKALGRYAKGKYRGELTSIPREDLPVHTRWWMGTSGSRAHRAFEWIAKEKTKVKTWNGDYYQFQAPTWVDYKKYPAQVSEIYNPPKEDTNEYLKSFSVFKENVQF